jgi:predicted negative regulator of RcsB-dependent stress response
MEETILALAINSGPVLVTLVVVGFAAWKLFQRLMAYHEAQVVAYQALVNDIREESEGREKQLMDFLKQVAKVG